MRLFLLPVSTRRTLIYCERAAAAQTTAQPTTSQPLSERLINRASATWATWEKADKGWQKQITTWGNQLFKRIPYEEWGLKTIPPATKQRLQDVDAGKLKLECLYPPAFLKSARVPEVLKALATERQKLHSRSLWTCVAWMPITLPFTFVPIIPNFPLFYLVFRAYSHYRALYGGKLLEHLLQKNLVTPTASAQMDRLYTAGLLHPSREKIQAAEKTTDVDTEQVVRVVEAQTKGGKEEVMLLQRWNGKLIAEGFDLPEMEVEIERAVEQVEKAIHESKDSNKSKEELVDDKKKMEETPKQKTG